MPAPFTRRGLFVAPFVLVLACVAGKAVSQGDAPDSPGAQDAPDAPGAQEKKPDPKAAKVKVPAFVEVPAGQVWPGCTDKEYEDRHRGRADLKTFLRYDVWGNLPPFPLLGFSIGKYEVTNAQWKYYMDKEFRVEHTTQKGDTLKALAEQYVKFRGEPVDSEWMAIYALNWKTIVDGWREMKVKVKKGKDADGKDIEVEEPVWQAGWPIENPPTDPPNDISTLELPKGLKLFLYRTRVPQHWYGWCRISGLQIGREYCDPSKPAAEAFVVPDEQPFKALALSDTDFAAYPARSVSPNEILAFCEWAGCELPTEYEWERAARGENLRWPYPFGSWNYNAQKNLIAWADNERCRVGGPMRVDDESVSGSDSPFGARHMAGNVWELTRTFYDVHPKVTPEPPPLDLGNYALTAKGGSFGDGWQLLMVCARTGLLGANCELSLKLNNRADSLGFRLARHPDHPGNDLLLHSIRRLTYDAPSADWRRYLPHGFAMERMAGVEDVTIEDAEAPYIHVRKRASAIAFAPLWVTTLDQKALRAKPSRTEYHVLGALRSEVPLKMGVRLTDAQMRKLLDDRERFDALVKARNGLPPKKKALVPEPVPPDDYEPDEYENLTEKNREIWGLWRETTVAPGEWFVVYWQGFIGLVNPTLTMPPDAIVMVDSKQINRKAEQPGTASLSLGKDTIQLKFQVWEQPTDRSKQINPPDQQFSEDWAMCEAYPPYFIKGGAKARPICWDVDVAFPIASEDDPAWKALTSSAARAVEKRAEPADGKPEDKKTSSK